MSDRSSNYIPGVCNIGPTEKRRRARIGWMGFAGVVFLWGLLVVMEARPAWRLLVFFPAAMMAAGWLQAAMGFCASFGLSGVFKFGSDHDRADSVMEAAFRKKDRFKACLIIALSILAGAGFGILAFCVG